ncbi:MAG TPA: hypothetical protein VN719_06460, partial [Gemmatimonadales bacterium]|nr:hypothetical protein [Gemmatimonadales bacterium]
VVQRQKRELRDRAVQDRESGRSSETGRRWGSLTREERNAIRRQQYRARREVEKQDPEAEARRRAASRQRYHKSFRDNPEAVRERRRQYRQRHVAEINSNQREYRKHNAAALNRKRREYRRLQAERSAQTSSSRVHAPATPEDAARSWRARQEKAGPERSAEESAQAWASRGRQQPTGQTAEDAARNWLARRHGRDSAEAERTAAEPSPPIPQPGPDRETDDEHVRNPTHRRDHDLEF